MAGVALNCVARVSQRLESEFSLVPTPVHFWARSDVLSKKVRKLPSCQLASHNALTEMRCITCHVISPDQRRW
jgi:hypothetical protein